MSETTVPIEKYREVTTQSALKDAEIKQLKQSLADAEFLLNRIKTEKDSIDAAQREDAVAVVVRLSKGAITKDSLKDVPTETVNRMAELALQITPASTVQIMRQAEADAAKPKNQGTVGYWNPTTKQWEGGVS